MYLYFHTLDAITVTIVSTPGGTPVSGSTNTFDYPILSSVTLTCMVTSSDGSTFTVTGYQWDTTRCFTNNAHDTPTCFPAGQTTQNVTGINLLAEDAGIITCTIFIYDVDYTSEPLTLLISGVYGYDEYVCNHLICTNCNIIVGQTLFNIDCLP